MLDERVPGLLRPALDRVGVLRGAALVLAGRNADAIVTTNPSRGATTCTFICGLLGLRKLILLEYIVHPPGDRDVLRRAWFGLLRRRLLGRALIRAQVLSEWEAGVYPAMHRIPSDRFEVLRWPGRFDDSPMPALNGGRRVLASGRRTDWSTFFAASDGADWDLRAICTAADLPSVQRLAVGRTVAIRHDIPADEHQAEVDEATVYVIPVAETGASIGQIRVMNAAQAGVPTVVSDVKGLRGYVDDTCAVVVPPGDPTAIRDAVDALLDDPGRREALRLAARRRGGTMSDYVEAIGGLVTTAVATERVVVHPRRRPQEGPEA